MSNHYFIIAWFMVSAIMLLAQDRQQYAELSYEELDSLMYLAYHEYDIEQAIFYTQVSLDKAAAEKGTQDTTYADYTANLGVLYSVLEDYDKALTFLLEAKDIRKKVLGSENMNYANSLSSIGEAYFHLDEYEKSLAHYIESKDIRAKLLGKNNKEYAITITNLGFLCNRMGYYEDALTFFLEGMEIRAEVLGKNHIDYGNSMNALGNVYANMGDNEKALSYFIQARDIRVQTLGKENLEYTTILNNLGEIYSDIGEGKKALVCYTEALAIERKIVGEQSEDYLVTLNNLACLYDEMGLVDRALSMHLELKRIKEVVHDPNHTNLAVTYSNLAGTYENIPDYEKALLFYKKAKAIYAQKLGKTHVKHLVVQNNLLYTYVAFGRYEEAKQMIEEVIAICTNINLKLEINPSWADTLAEASYLSNNHIDVILSTLSGVYHFLNSDSTINNTNIKKIIVARLALSLLERLRNEITGNQNKLELLELSSLWTKKILAAYTPKDAAMAFAVADENKSVLLQQATTSAQDHHLGTVPDSLIVKNKKNYEKRNQLQAQLLEDYSSAEKLILREELNTVSRTIDQQVELIRTRYPKYYTLKYERKQLSLESVQEELDEETALLEYVVGDSMIHIFCIDKTGITWARSLVDVDALNKAIRKLHSSLSDYDMIVHQSKLAYQNYTESAYWFYQQLIAPVLTNKKGIENLIIITDGKMGHLPFEVFLSEQAPQGIAAYHELSYLVKEYNVSYNYSAAIWKENLNKEVVQHNQKMLAIAADYNNRLDTAYLKYRLATDQKTRKTLSPLPAARQEVEALEKVFAGTFLFGEQASEKTVKQEVANYAILHFATHGILNSKNPILSSLVLTETNDSLENNFWQAHEISKLNLKADLAVLSACETGYGKFEKGNGIASLARAFAYAGVPAMVVSLWQVNDVTTESIMQKMYQNLAEGMPKDKALRQAKLNYLGTTKGIAGHPAFWAPFVQMGNTQPIKIASNRYSWWWMVLLFSILGMVGWYWIRRRL